VHSVLPIQFHNRLGAIRCIKKHQIAYYALPFSGKTKELENLL
jgi:hypothetical protein